MVTIREVAKAAGVSVATASRALNGLDIVTRPTREKIEEAASRLNYVPHSGARSLTRRTTDTIGLILPDLYGEFFSEVIRGVDTVVKAAGKHLLLSNMHGDPAEMIRAVRAMRGRVDALLLMPPNSTDETIDASVGGDIPVVLLNARAERGALPFVAVDNCLGARLVTEHLIDRGARALVHLAGPADNFDARERERGFRDVVRERLGESEPLIIAGDFRDGAGQVAARRLLADGVRFDAVFAANDLMAVDLMTELGEAGLAAGRDVLVAGFDDIPLARFVTPRLTTVHSDINRLGAAATQMVLRLARGEDLSAADGIVITPTLAARPSTAGPLRPAA